MASRRYEVDRLPGRRLLPGVQHRVSWGLRRFGRIHEFSEILILCLITH